MRPQHHEGYNEIVLKGLEVGNAHQMYEGSERPVCCASRTISYTHGIGTLGSKSGRDVRNHLEFYTNVLCAGV